MPSNSKGAARERELVNRFDADGWGALRLPSSGSRTARELPDVLAGRKLETDYGQAWAIELKSGQATTLYVDASEVDDLRAFAHRWGARPLLAARFTTQASSTATYLIEPERARGPTDGGRYGLPRSDSEERAFAVVSDDGVTVR